MTSRKMIRRAPVGTALAALALCLGSVAVATPALAQSRAARPSETLTLSQNTGTLVRLSSPMSDVFIANDSIADVQVRSSTQLYVFGKSSGETTVYATDKSGRVVYAANVRVGTNAGSVGEMLRLALPKSWTAAPSVTTSALRLSDARTTDFTGIGVVSASTMRWSFTSSMPLTSWSNAACSSRPFAATLSPTG